MSLVFALFLLLFIGGIGLVILSVAILEDGRFLVVAGIMLVAAIAIALSLDEVSHRGKVPVNCEAKTRFIYTGKVMVPQHYQDCDWITPTPGS